MAESSGSMRVPKAKRGPTGFHKGAVWGGLVGLFLGVYGAASGSFATSTAVIAIGGVAVVAGVVVFVFARRRWQRAQADLNAGLAALARGQLALANETFMRWCTSSNAILSALARHNLGWTLLRQGRLDEAFAVASDNDATHERDLAQITMDGISSGDLSLIAALRGNIEAAESWLKVTERRAASGSNPSLPALRVYACAVLDCRKERYEDAARLLDERWAECEAALTGSELRPLRVVRAFAVASGGPRNAGIAENLLSSSKPVYDGEYDFLGVAWPAMHTFLAAHRLTRERAA